MPLQSSLWCESSAVADRSLDGGDDRGQVDGGALGRFLDDSCLRPAESTWMVIAAQPPRIQDAVRCPLLDSDPEAWLRCCTARFLPVARRIAGDDATARDALQDSWIIVLEKLYQYRGEPPACGWVGAIVRHEAGHRAARKNREAPAAPVDGDSGAASLDDALYRRQLLRILLEAIDELPPTYRDVVRLRDFDERPVAEVARELHISRSNVAVRLHRAHNLLRRRLVRMLEAPAFQPPSGARQVRVAGAALDEG